MSERSDVSCGYQFTIGKRYQVFAFTTKTGLTTGLCSVTELSARGAGFQPHLAGTGPPGDGNGVLILSLIGLTFGSCGVVLRRLGRARAASR